MTHKEFVRGRIKANRRISKLKISPNTIRKYLTTLILPWAICLVACSKLSGKIQGSIDDSNLPTCALNAVTTSPCKIVASGVAVSSSVGSDVTTWTNPAASTTVQASIPDGFYQSKSVNFIDNNLLAGNILSGVSIFGVTGTASGTAYPACTEDALNGGQCSTSANRYVTATNGGNISGTNGSLTATITKGFYDGTKTCTMSDTNLVAANIKSGVSIFGTAGSLSSAYAACTDDALNVGQCSTSINRYVTATSGANVIGANASLTATIPRGYYDGTKSATMSDSNLVASKIATGVSIFGTVGTYIGSFDLNMASNASRDPGQVPIANNATLQTTSNQLTLYAENTTYSGGLDLPSSGGYRYRDIPDDTRDNNGYFGTSCKYAPRPTNDCGLSQGTLAARITNCATVNPAASNWDGSTQCNRGQGSWKLVARSGANKEVWQDQRTGLLWSSYIAKVVNWCTASGATSLAPFGYKQSYNNAPGTPIYGNGTIGSIVGGSSATAGTVTIQFTSATSFTVSGGGCASGSITSGGLTTTPGSTVTWSRPNYCSFTLTQGSTNFASNDTFLLIGTVSSRSCAPGASSGLQPASPISYCAEAAGLNAPAGETWSAGGYSAAKGGLGKNSSPSVRWRLPTIEDFMLASVNGIRFVMPDMGIDGSNRPIPDGSTAGGSYGDWTSTVEEDFPDYSWYFDNYQGSLTTDYRNNTRAVRCVGR